MRTFNASLSTGVLCLAVIVPPAVFFSLVQVVAHGLESGSLGVGHVFLLVALAQLIPLVALLWILFTTAAYSVSPGKLVVHHVAFDREISLRNVTTPPCLIRGVVTLEATRPLRLRVDEPESCLNALKRALGTWPMESASAA